MFHAREEKEKKCTWEAKRPSRRESSAKKLKPGSLKGSKVKGLEKKKKSWTTTQKIKGIHGIILRFWIGMIEGDDGGNGGGGGGDKTWIEFF